MRSQIVNEEVIDFKSNQRVIHFGGILLGVMMLSIGLEMFLTPHKIIPGGIKGVAILLSHVTEMKMGLLLLFINIPFVIFKRRNAIQTFTAILTFLIIAILIIVMHPFPPFIQDPLIAAICGGITFGIGVGLVVRYGWYSDGVNEVAYYLKKRTKLSIAEMLMFINMFMLTCGGFLFGWDQAMYSIIAYYLAYKAIQFTIEYNSKQLICVWSHRHEELRQLLIQEFDSDIDFLNLNGIATEANGAQLFLVLSKNKIKKFNITLNEFDPLTNYEISYANYAQAEPYYRV